jgi:hypothetical protein
MEKNTKWLLEYKSNTYSQTGEDGIISKVLELLPERDKWCVEFGAWDGLYLTNTRLLIEQEQYNAVLIEADKKKWQKLSHNYSKNPRVRAINAFVDVDGDNSLDNILSLARVPLNFDLLSIDIDGNDYHVWQALHKFNPKVVVIEFNPTIPTEVDFVQPLDWKLNQGSSIASICGLAKEKGYELVSILPINAVFVKRDYFPIFEIADNSPDLLRDDNSLITHLFTGFDGTVITQGYGRLPWHNITMVTSKLQRLPFFMRKYPCNYNIVQKFFHKIYKLMDWLSG